MSIPKAANPPALRVFIVLALTVAVFASLPLLMVTYIVPVKTLRDSGGYWLLSVIAAGGIGAYEGQKLARSLIRRAVAASIAGIAVAALVALLSLYLVIPIIGE
jgi:hypothetical protein